MYKKRPSVIIGIPAHNEQKNIIKLLKAILRQNTPNYFLKEIIVFSDASTDKTKLLVENFSKENKIITLYIGAKRLGKPKRINQIFQKSNSDAVIVLDGDIQIKSKNTLALLVQPLLSNQGVELTSGHAENLKPKNYFEKIVSIGLQTWNNTKIMQSNSEMYTCEGQIRAFSKRLYTILSFPASSADDVYPFLFTKKNKMGYKYVKGAKIYYSLPENISDFVRQHTRYLRSKKIQLKTFNPEFVDEQYTIGTKLKALAVIKIFFINPIEITLYILILLIPKFFASFGTYGMESAWSIIKSTKK